MELEQVLGWALGHMHGGGYWGRGTAAGIFRPLLHWNLNTPLLKFLHRVNLGGCLPSWSTPSFLCGSGLLPVWGLQPGCPCPPSFTQGEVS